MSCKLHPGRFLICCFLFTLPAAAQLDSSALHAKYGAPIKRETFHMPSGFDLVVDYGANHQICKLELPALMPTNERVSNTSEMNRRMYEVLAELIPDSMRGKELGRRAVSMGAVSVVFVEYEHITVSEMQDANQFGNRITVTFKNGSCQNLAGH